MPHLFEPLNLRDVTFRNRIGISPMCQYSAVDGVANEWHFVHLGARATGGAGLVIVEATGVEARGRITPGCLGLWNDAQEAALCPIAAFITSQGAVAGVQIGHAGRKASTSSTWTGGKMLSESEGGWDIVGPSAIQFDAGYKTPAALTEAEIAGLTQAFVQSAQRADRAGFDVLELHGAHGYLMHSFLSPISNQRTDRYGGSFENRIRFVVETAEAVRAAWPTGKPLFVRISSTDWVEGGWSIDLSVELASVLKKAGVDLVDCSSGGSSPAAVVPTGPGYQVPFADMIRHATGVATAAVGMITDPTHADEIVRNGRADMVLIGRESLRDAEWPYRAAKVLGMTDLLPKPNQYLRS